MPPRKKQTENLEKEESSKTENDMIVSDESPVVDSKEIATESNSGANEESGSGQLFFSTDGSEPEKAEENPYLEEKQDDIAKSNKAEVVDSVSDKAEEDGKAKSNEQVTQPNHSNNKPNRGPHPHNQKKQNWQEKKKQRNKQRQKFKKPRRLPYEETEAKPLELGDLLENESLRSEEGISELAEDFNSSDQKSIELDELLALSLQELKEKVSDYELDLGQAPLKEEIFDALLAKCLEDKIPVIVSGIIQVMEDGHAFLLQQRDDYRLKSQCPFIPEILVKKYGLKVGQNVRATFVQNSMDRLVLYFYRSSR